MIVFNYELRRNNEASPKISGEIRLKHVNKPFCMALAEIYVNEGMTQQDVADAAGISTDTITNLRKGGNPSKRVERSLCRVLGKTREQLFPEMEVAENGAS